MRRKWPAVLVLSLLAAAVIYAALAASARPAPDHAYFGASAPRTAVIAHRGGAGLRPENTLAAFSHAAELGVDVLEMDLRATADGVIVLMHDATVDRTTESTGRVDAMALADLQKLDAGYAWSNDGGRTFPFRAKGIRVPALEEVIASHPRMRMLLEMKPSGREFAASLCSLLRKSAMAGRVLVASFDDGTIADFRAACPEVATSMAFGEARRFAGAALLRLEGVTSPAAPALLIPDRYRDWELVRPALLAAARNRNLNVQVWTVNDVTRMRQLIKLGVDGIMTDRPDRLLRVLATPENMLSAIGHARMRAHSGGAPP